MSGPQEQLNQSQLLLRESLRQLTETALQFEDARLPQLLKAIGAIASASIDIEEIAQADTSPEQTPFLEPTTEPVLETPVLAPVQPVEPVAKIPKQASRKKAEVKVTAETSPPPEIFQSAIRFMISQAGVELKASDVLAHLPSSISKQSKIMGKLLGVINDSVPGVLVEKHGQTRATKYIVRVDQPTIETVEEPTTNETLIVAADIEDPGEDIEREPTAHDLEMIEEDDPTDQVIVTPLAMPAIRQVPTKPAAPEKQQDEVVMTLTNWGLSYSLNGHKEIRLGGEKLKLREAAADTLLVLAQYPEGKAFHELREVMNANGKNFDPSFLMGILQELKFVIETHARNKWADEIRQDDDGGTRYVQLKGALPLEEFPDFLACERR